MSAGFVSELSPIASFLAALTTTGPEIISMHPKINLDKREKRNLAMKSMPVGGSCGDFISVTLGDYLAVSTLLSVPAFEDSYDGRDTYVSIGFLVPKNINPLPYQNILEKIALTCKNKQVLTVPVLQKVTNRLYSAITTKHGYKFTIDTGRGVKVEFSFETILDQRGKSPSREKLAVAGKYKAVLSMEEINQREKNAFLLDKFILKQICTEGPVTLEDIRRKTIPLEIVLGSKVSLVTIEEICRKYVDQGIIKTVD